ncbi:MAG: formate--tetrahydrofolate ligase [Acidobacteriota bacterium]
MLPIAAIAAKLGLPDEYLVPYGEQSAKVKLDLLTDPAFRPTGRFILVTAITPTSAGEGKTVVSISLTQGLERIGKRVVATLREPSLGPVFGIKGGATGGGRAQVLPAEKINLHFNGDFHAITSAHNLLAAAIDWHLHQGNRLRLDINSLTWPRTMDINDRALRQIIVGLGGKSNGLPRQTGFVITAASEVMAIMGFATSYDDLRTRLDRIAIGLDADGRIVPAAELGMTGAMMVLLRDALLPNIAQTTEGTPVFVHTGPFGNIAHGTSSLVSQLMALRCADYVVNEAGFGADLGAEKYFDIVMPRSGIKPAAVVLVATARALAAHGAVPGATDNTGPAAVRRGLPNLARHLENMRKYGSNVVIAINHFPTDTAAELDVIRDFCREQDVPFALCDGYSDGAAGAVDLAEKVVAAVESGDTARVSSLYDAAAPLEEKIERIATSIYGAAGVTIENEARRKLKRYTEQGFGHLPICMAKTQSSLSDNPKLAGAPTGWTLTVSDTHLSAGAGFVVAVAGSMMLMPGLPAVPQALRIDLNADGTITGMNY